MKSTMKQQLLSGIPCRVSLPHKYVEAFIHMAENMDRLATFSIQTEHDNGCASTANNDLSKCSCKEVDIEIVKVSHA